MPGFGIRPKSSPLAVWFTILRIVNKLTYRGGWRVEDDSLAFQSQGSQYTKSRRNALKGPAGRRNRAVKRRAVQDGLE